ncbi:MFS transporter [Geodermatophilus sp. SYSU D00815]
METGPAIAERGTGASSAAPENKDSLKKVTTASMVGTVIEWFDFNLFGSMAALVLGPLFFPSDNPVTSTLLSLATFGVAFFARPLGGIIFGHLGDRIGRKKSLVVTLLLMGGATFLIGVLPTYAAIGVAAPVLLVLLRIIQGLALGGEYGGAILMVVEHNGSKGRRGFMGAWLSGASPIGFVLSAALIAIVSGAMSEEAWLSWGWRIPFLVSAVLVLAGLYIRIQLEESPMFKQMLEQKSGEKKAKVPFFELLTRYPKMVLVSVLVPLGIHAGYYITIIFALSYAKETAGFSASASLALVIIASVCYFISIMISGAVSDRIGRRLPMMVGVLGFGFWSFALFPLVESGNAFQAGLGFSVGLILLGMLFGPMGTWLSELFGTAVRYTGISFGYQIASAVAGGISPALAVALLDEYGSTVPVSIYALAISAIAFTVLAITRTNRHNKLDEDEAVVAAA